jgi:hypothetical protein
MIMIGLVLDFIKNWNFLIPLAVWLSRESYLRLKKRGQRVRLWGLRRSRRIRLVVDEQRLAGNYLTGDIGPLAEARAVQKLLENLRRIGINADLESSEQFDRSDVGDMVIIGMIRDDTSLATAMLHRLNCGVQVSGEMVKLGEREILLDLELTEKGLRIGTEYGIFVRAAGPDDPRHRMIVITALTSIGLEMTVDALVSSKVMSTAIGEKGPGVFLVSMDSSTGRTAVEKLQVRSPISSSMK